MTTVAAPRVPAELEAADLAEVLHDAELVGLDLSGIAIGVHAAAVSMEECRVSVARLTSARIDRIRMVDVEFTGCDLSGASFVEPVLRRVRFTDCRLSGTAFELAKLDDVQFVECRMDTVGFSMARMAATHFERCDLTEASFRNANLQGCSIRTSQLRAADVGGLRATDLRLHGSDLSDLSTPAGIAGAQIDDSQLIPLAVQLLAAARIRVTEDDGPPAMI